MSALISAASAALPLSGWGLHTLWMRRRLATANKDPLTGLLRRDAFEQQAARMLTAQMRPCAVVVVDLDGFKAVNDTWGHAAGDEAIRAAGQVLGRAGRDSCGGLVARLGGDEFAAVVPISGTTALTSLLEGWHRELRAPLPFEGHELRLGASLGAVLHEPAAPADLSRLLRLADEAMYKIKRHGGGWLLSNNDGSQYATVNGRRAGRRGAIPLGEQASATAHALGSTSETGGE
ncbi:GGDEF domain-containing protein [Streptomyces sp. CA-250714]|uniref:GGDEF domain-containing protein n=1 Tax=Streptomyces sp. CA-250714 TaxID=3240060 RepID=UPI003D8C492E